MLIYLIYSSQSKLFQAYENSASSSIYTSILLSKTVPIPKTPHCNMKFPTPWHRPAEGPAEKTESVLNCNLPVSPADAQFDDALGTMYIESLS